MSLNFLSPGVVVEEVKGQAGAIPAAATSGFALGGYSPRGPEDKAYISTTFQEWVQRFGGFSSKSRNAYVAAAYFQNGGNRLIFFRTLHGDATFAEGTLGDAWRFRASGRGEWANGMVISLTGNRNFYDAATGNFSAFDLRVSVIDPQTGQLTTSETYEALVLDDVDDPSYIVKVLESQSEDVFADDSPGGGIPDALAATSVPNAAFGTTVANQNTYNGTLALTGQRLLPGSLQMTIAGQPLLSDDGNGSLVGSDPSHGVVGSVNYATGAVVLTMNPAPTAGQALVASFVRAPSTTLSVTLAGGTDGGRVEAADLVSAALQGAKRGLYMLDDVNEQMTLDLPDFAGDAGTAKALLDYASARGDILVILQPPQGSSPQAAVNWRRNSLGNFSDYGAVYWPWVKVPDPLNKNRPITIPPSGHVAGRCAFTDLTANVGKAPAGVARGQLSFVLGLERTVSQGDRDIVYPAQVNPIRSDSEAGTAIWGNRTLQPVGDFTDVNIRRLFIYLKKTQEAGLLDILFEDVGPGTFGVITARLDSFLEGLFLGNVIGSGVQSRQQAFKVICNETNNPEAVQVQRRIIIDEYIKPNLTAEVIHLRLQRVFDASQT